MIKMTFEKILDKEKGTSFWSLKRKTSENDLLLEPEKVIKMIKKKYFKYITQISWNIIPMVLISYKRKEIDKKD